MFKLCRAAAVVSAIVFAPQVLATSVAQEAQQLLQQGQANDALKKLDAHLAKNPQDAEARFARGLALVKLNRAKDAIRVFADLTRDYPQLPEPYNNLAVLYAADGNYNKAREALEAALATHPSYATAHENLQPVVAPQAGAGQPARQRARHYVHRSLGFGTAVDGTRNPGGSARSRTGCSSRCQQFAGGNAAGRQ